MTANAWYNKLPTGSKRQIDEFHREWRNFNLEVIKHARDVIIRKSFLSNGTFTNDCVHIRTIYLVLRREYIVEWTRPVK